MSSLRIPRLVSNKHWPGIIERHLDGAHAEQVEARETMWVEVERYVRVARLPIGPLADDPDVRPEIALRLLQRVEQDSFRHLRLWCEGQRHQQDFSTWWGWIGTMTRRLAIDIARGSKQNLARRGEPYRWARVVSVDPAVLDEAQQEALGSAFDFLEQSSTESAASYMEALQGMLCGRAAARDGSMDGDQPWSEFPSSATRGENGDDGSTR